MIRLFELIEKRKKLFIYITLLYIVFNACLIYPISFENGVMNSFLLTTSLAYLSISLLFTRIFPKAHIKVYITTLLLTSFGMGIRLLIELNNPLLDHLFSLQNILVYIISVPAFVLLGYHFLAKIDFSK